MGKLKYPDTASRNAAIAELKKKSDKIEQQRAEPVKAQKDLIAQNQTKIDSRAAVKKQLDGKKAWGNFWLIGGIIAIAVGAIFLKQTVPMIATIAGGVLAFLIGIIIKKSKAVAELQKSFTKLNEELASFDEDNKTYQSVIDSLQEEIDNIKEEIESIKKEERLAKYYKWCDENDTGHLAFFVSVDFSPFSDPVKSYKPGKIYKAGEACFKRGSLYMDEMVYASITKYGEICFAKADPGTHKLQVETDFTTGSGSLFNRITEPIPFRDTDKSKFIRMHLDISQKGTQTFVSEFDDFDEFLEDIGMSIEDFMKKYIK